MGKTCSLPSQNSESNLQNLQAVNTSNLLLLNLFLLPPYPATFPPRLQPLPETLLFAKELELLH
jgi:hypothetical protein